VSGATDGWIPDVRQAQLGDRGAFERLVARFREGVLATVRKRLAHHQDAEEVTQEAFVQAWRELPRLRDPSRFAAWLHRIARTRGSNFRTRWRQETLPLDGVDWAGQFSRGTSVVNGATPTDTARLRGALNTLSDVNRQTANLFYVDGYSIQEIAGQLQVPTGTVKRRLHDARAQLKQLYAKEEPKMTTDAVDANRPYPNELLLPGTLLRGALGRASAARSTDGTRPKLESVLARWDETSLTFCAADGFRMAEVRLAPVKVTERWASYPGRHELLLTPRTATAVTELLAAAPEGTSASFVLDDLGNHVFILLGDEVRFTPSVGGDYSPLKLIPASWETRHTRVRVDTTRLRDALHVADIATRGDAPLVLDASGGTLRLYVKATETAPAYETSMPATLEGASQRIALNDEYLAQLVEVATEPELELTWGDPIKPLIVREVGPHTPARTSSAATPTLTAKWAIMPMEAPSVFHHQFTA
jgi:RNA polymerase sigma-70 factor (ECF subfamily)